MSGSFVSFCLRVWISLLFSSIRVALGYLVQTIPEGNFPVCANEQLTYTCKSSFDTLVWQQGDDFHEFSTAHSQVNDSETVGQFFVELTEVNGTSLTSTATSFMTNSSHEGIQLECFDGGTLFSKDVIVVAGPDDCKGTVTCSISPDPDSKLESSLTITLNGTTGLRCVKNYEFVFNDASQYSQESPVVASFVIDKTLGLQYIDQAIYTVDGEGRKGGTPCLFSIIAPNPIAGSSSSQSCNGSMIIVNIEFEMSTIPPGSCLDGNDLNLIYSITFANDVLEPIDTTSNSVEISVDQQLELEISITPVLPDLGLSGSPYSSTIVIDTECSGSLNTWIIIAVAVVIGILLVIIVILIFGCLYARHHSRTNKSVNFKDSFDQKMMPSPTKEGIENEEREKLRQELENSQAMYQEKTKEIDKLELELVNLQKKSVKEKEEKEKLEQEVKNLQRKVASVKEEREHVFQEVRRKTQSLPRDFQFGLTLSKKD